MDDTTQPLQRKSKLLEEVQQNLRRRHYGIRTEEASATNSPLHSVSQ